GPPPFLATACRLRLSADHRGVDGQPLHVRVRGHRLEDAVEHAPLDPAVIAPLDRLIGAEALRQIAPARPRARQLQQRIKEEPRVAARTALALAPAGHELAQPLPLIVPENLAFHASLPPPAVRHSSGKRTAPENGTS